jgi:hypothetical protein
MQLVFSLLLPRRAKRYMKSANLFYKRRYDSGLSQRPGLPVVTAHRIEGDRCNHRIGWLTLQARRGNASPQCLSGSNVYPG